MSTKINQIAKVGTMKLGNGQAQSPPGINHLQQGMFTHLVAYVASFSELVLPLEFVMTKMQYQIAVIVQPLLRKILVAVWVHFA